MDGRDALEVAGRAQGTLHMLVTDVIMPGLNGPQLASELQRQRPGVRVLFVSGYTADAITGRGGLATENQLLEKPFTPAALLRRVRKALDGS